QAHMLLCLGRVLCRGGTCRVVGNPAVRASLILTWGFAPRPRDRFASFGRRLPRDAVRGLRHHLRAETPTVFVHKLTRMNPLRLSPGYLLDVNVLTCHERGSDTGDS